MLKKIIYTLCIAMLVSSLSVTPSFAASSKGMTEEAKVLTALGIIDKKVPSSITNDVFFSALSKFMTDGGVEPETFARNRGFIEKGTSYNPKDKIKGEDAVKYAVKLLGYEYAAEYSSYASTASDIGLYTKLNNNRAVTYDEFVNLLYSMLDVETMQISFSTDNKHSLKEDAPLITIYRHINMVEGIETSNGITTLEGTRVHTEDQMAIDGVWYTKTKDVADMLGEKVYAYVRPGDNSDNEVLYLRSADSPSEVVTVNDEDIVGVSEDYSKLIYEDERDKEHFYKLSPVMRVIYNGEFYGDYTASDFELESGTITLIDNDRDNVYDVVKIVSYDTMIVGGIDTAAKKIYAKTRLENHIETIDLSDANVVYDISDDSGEMAFSDIESGDILSVAASKSTDSPVCSIIVSRATISGELNGINTSKNTVTIEGELYKVNEIADLYKAAENLTVELGGGYLYYLDAFGKIAYYKKADYDNYAVFYKPIKEDGDENYKVKYFDINGQWTISPLAKRVSINGVEYTSSDSRIETEMRGYAGKIMLVKVNAKGQVTKIEKYTETDEWAYQNFSKTYDSDYSWRAENKSFECKLYADNDCKVFIIPNDLTKIESYVVRDATGFFKANTIYNVSAYNTDEYGFTKLFSYKYDGVNIDSSEILFVVTGKSEVVVGDEVTSSITGNGGGYQNMELLGSNENTFDAYDEGDVLKFNIGANGRITSCTKICSLKDTLTPSKPTNYHVKDCTAIGTVKSIDAVSGRMLVDFGDSKNSFRVSSTLNVLKFTKDSSTCEISNVHEILVGDKIVCRIKTSQLMEAVICR